MSSSLHPYNSCRRSHAQDCCTFWSQCHLHNFSSTRRTQTIPRRVHCRHQCHLQHGEWAYSSLTNASLAQPSHFYSKRLDLHNKHHSSFMQTRRTCTGLCVACAGCIANTIFAAIRRRGVAACSGISATTTSSRASAELRPSSVHCAAALKAVCNAAHHTGDTCIGQGVTAA